MWVVIILGLVLIGFTSIFTYIFFHIYKLEKRLATTLEDVEVYLLSQYGEITNRNVSEVDLSSDSREDDD